MVSDGLFRRLSPIGASFSNGCRVTPHFNDGEPLRYEIGRDGRRKIVYLTRMKVLERQSLKFAAGVLNDADLHVLTRQHAALSGEKGSDILVMAIHASRNGIGEVDDRFWTLATVLSEYTRLCWHEDNLKASHQRFNLRKIFWLEKKLPAGGDYRVPLCMCSQK